MIAYTTLGTNDLSRAAAFYDELLALIGGKREMEQPGYFIAYGNGGPGAAQWLYVGYDSDDANVG
jgi:catechol 2,3-dioxygenase-like lactoylglutathione lyase family enzyme